MEELGGLEELLSGIKNMITHKILQIVNKLTDGVVTGIWVQIEISDGVLRLGYDTTLSADKQADLKTAIEDFAAIKTKEFITINDAKTAEQVEKARHTEVKVAKESVPIDSAVINQKAEELKLAEAEGEIKP